MRFSVQLAALRLVVVALVLVRMLGAAPPLSTIRDTVYKADGTRFSGTVIIEWRSFEASDTSFIGKNRLQLQVQDGFLNVRLVPTTTASTPAYYMVRFVAGGNVQFTEAWAVPPANEALRVRAVRIADPLLAPGQAAGLSGIEISDVEGLQTELDLRPKKGGNLTGPRAAVINADGEIESALGNPTECVHVDGTAGPCGGSGGAPVVGTFVDGETPNGAINGSNTVFSLSQTPNPATSLLLYRNGLLQKRFLDYDIAGTSIQFTPVAIPQPGDVLLASYRTAGSGGTLPQVLCTGVGTATSQTASTSLGSCTIPGGLLKSGDRVDLSFDYSHEGITTGFYYELRWGSTSLTTRTAGAGTNLATGRASVGIHASGAQWSLQSWGASLSCSAPLMAPATRPSSTRLPPPACGLSCGPSIRWIGPTRFPNPSPCECCTI